MARIVFTSRYAHLHSHTFAESYGYFIFKNKKQNRRVWGTFCPQRLFFCNGCFGGTCMFWCYCTSDSEGNGMHSPNCCIESMLNLCWSSFHTHWGHFLCSATNKPGVHKPKVSPWTGTHTGRGCFSGMFSIQSVCHSGHVLTPLVAPEVYGNFKVYCLRFKHCFDALTCCSIPWIIWLPAL